MGKASRRKRQSSSDQAGRAAAPARAPYVGRPFEGLAHESDWVAMREIVPAGLADVTLDLPAGADGEGGGPRDIRLVTVLPAAMPALHRADGTVMVALQSRTHSGDASRDVVQAVLAAVAAEPGTAVRSVPPATADTPRLQDLLAADAELDLQVQPDFGFWVEDDAGPEATAALEEMNAAAVPTERIDTVPSAYWVAMADRAYIRWILPDDEDTATTAMARLQAAGEHTLGEGTTLLGAFRAAGLLVPVIEVDPSAPAAEHGPALAALAERYAAVVGSTESLTPDERRARDGIVSRQVTLR